MIDPSILVGTVPVDAVVANDGSQDPLAQLRSALQQQAAIAANAQEHAKLLAATIEIQSELDACADVKSAAQVAARLIAQTIDVSRVQIAWRKSDAKSCELVADTGQIDADLGPKFIAAAEEICVRGATTEFPASKVVNRHALLAVAQYADAINATSIVASPMTDSDGAARGAIVAVCDKGTDSVNASLEAFTIALASKFSALETLQPRNWERLVRTVTDQANKSRRRIAYALTGCTLLVMLIPIHYQVPANCELQPVERRYVAAPFDGPLQRVLVRPGDTVEANETLARINPRELEYELAGIRAELKRAIQEQKGLMAEHDFGGSKIATLEADRLRSQQELLEYQRENLDVRSPIAGVVVSGDLRKSEGTPLTKGETMFEIAPLGQMVVEVAISEDDIAYVEVGMPVEFYLHAVPTDKLSGKIQHVHPQAELRDHDNIFVGEVLVTDTKGVLRPGMRGKSWIKSDRHTLGWNLFHKAFYSLRTSIGW